MSNISGENCSSYEDCYTEQALIFIPEVQTTFLFLYFLVSIVGTLGNLFIVITVIRWKFSCTKTHSCTCTWSNNRRKSLHGDIFHWSHYHPARKIYIVKLGSLVSHAKWSIISERNSNLFEYPKRDHSWHYNPNTSTTQPPHNSPQSVH